MELRPILLLFMFFALMYLLNYYDLYFIVVPARNATSVEFYSFFVASMLYTVANGLKFILVASIMYGCAMLFNLPMEGSSAFKNIFGLVVLLSYIFLLEKLYRIVYFTFYDANYTLADLDAFFPLSLYSDGDSGYLSLIFKEFSFFTLLYIIGLVAGTKSLFDIALPKAIIFAGACYVFPLIVWITIKFIA